jgi:hypothetical protein
MDLQGDVEVDPTLDPNQLLIAEYNYIAQTAFQVNEDRARVAVFYLTAVGGLLLAILGAQSQVKPTPGVYWAFAALFGAVSFSGLLTLLQLVRLRQAWFDSVRAMNRIKEYYVNHSGHASLPLALAWRASTMPRPFSMRTISFLYAVQVAALSGLTAGVTVMFVGFVYQGWWWGWALLVGVGYAFTQLLLYWRLMRRK